MREKLKITLLFFLIGINAFPQKETLPINKETKLIEFSDLVFVDSALTQNELYLRAKEWMARNFKSAKDVIQMEDKEAGIIIGKGYFSLREGKSCKIYFTLKIQVKNNRYKYWFSDFYHDCSPFVGYDGGPLEHEKPDCGFWMMAKREWIEIIPNLTDQNVKLMIQSLKAALSKGSNKNEKDKW
jgi:hypothetical protein